MVEVTSVPMSSGRMPYFGLSKSGVHSVPVTKSQIGTCWKKGTDSSTRTTTIAIVVRTEDSAARNSANSISFSLTRLDARRRRLDAAMAASDADAEGGTSFTVVVPLPISRSTVL